MRIKRALGNVKRAISGIILNNFDKLPLNRRQGFDIGASAGGRRLECLRVGSGKFAILFVSGIHGNEVGTVKLARNLINWLEGSEDRYRDFSFYIVPCLNPDGFEQACKNPDYFNGGSVGRFNANGVDINRNFETPNFQSNSFWAKGKNYREKTPVFAGDHANSEPEIKSITKLIKEKNINLVVAFHNAGGDVIGNTIEPSPCLAKTYCNVCGFKYETNEEWNKTLRTGTFKEWTELHNIPFIEIEGSSRWGSDWNRQKPGIMKILEILGEKIS